MALAALIVGLVALGCWLLTLTSPPRVSITAAGIFTAIAVCLAALALGAHLPRP